MEIRFECPDCGNQLSAKSDYMGKEGQCKCGTALIVPGDSDLMKFACRHCGKGISVSNRHAGKKGKCPLCQSPISVPILGIRIETHLQAESPPAALVQFPCTMCTALIQAPKTSAGNIIECPHCGCFAEVPGGQKPALNTVPEGQAGVSSSRSTGTVICPSCERKISDQSTICTQCGIFIKSGRPILTARDADPDEIEEKAHGVVRAISWLIPFGIYPVYSEAFGNHKPYATWGIAAVTILVSFWFLALGFSDSPKMLSAKNLMLWSGRAKPDAERIQLFYEYTNYGDVQAYMAKRDELSPTTAEEELDVVTLKALTPEQQCFGRFKPYQLLTHAFLHGGIFHLAGNMLFLLIFGSRVNSVIGNVMMIILYPILAIAAAITYLGSMGFEPPTPMLGASGAVMGLAGAYLLLFPIHKIYMAIWMRWGLFTGFHLSFSCFAVHGFWVVLFYIMFDIVAIGLMLETGTAHWAHVGGMLWGFLIALILLNIRIVYSHSNILSLLLGKHAWRFIGTPSARMK